jgi:hypothetical protein
MKDYLFLIDERRYPRALFSFADQKIETISFMSSPEGKVMEELCETWKKEGISVIKELAIEQAHHLYKESVAWNSDEFYSALRQWAKQQGHEALVLRPEMLKSMKAILKSALNPIEQSALIVQLSRVSKQEFAEVETQFLAM